MTAADELLRGRDADRVSRLAPLGLRFWDAADGRFVCDHDLAVRARRADAGECSSWTAAAVTTAGVYAFHGLPGLADLDDGGAGDDAFWAAHPPAVELRVEVCDRAGRFLPFALTARAPVRGVLAWRCAGDGFESPPGPAAPIPLMSAPTRAVIAPRCAVRAELWDASDPQESRWRPAAWAVLEVRAGARVRARSFADAQGRVLVPFAFPELGPEIPIDSPLAAGGPRSPAELAVSLAVRWRPGASTAAPPDLCATLGQAPATPWSDMARTTPLDTATLRISEQALLGSRHAITGRRSPRLLITPA